LLGAPPAGALMVASDGLMALQGLEGLAGLEGLEGLQGLEGMEGLAGLARLDGLDALDPEPPMVSQNAQDPTDSLWRAARQAFNRGDYTSAANLYGDIARRYPSTARAGDALYWAAFALYKKGLARRDACSAGLRRKAVFLVSQKHAEETEDILLDVAQHDPDPEVRQQAVFWLSQVPTDRAVGMLDSILRTTGDAELREKALFALSQQHSPRAGQILRTYAENANAPSEAREKAIFWLGQQHSGENAAFLRGLYGKLTEEDLKEKVIFSLSQMHDADNNRWLMDIALNEREPIEMRKKALFWAGQTGGDLTQLSGLYERMQNRDMKEQLIFVYSQRHEAAA